MKSGVALFAVLSVACLTLPAQADSITFTNLNLGRFDVILGYKPEAQLTVGSTIMFEVDDLGRSLTLLDWTRVGVRWQEVGENAIGNGSDKQVSLPPPSVPESGTIAMLLVAGAAAATCRRRRRRATDGAA